MRLKPHAPLFLALVLILAACDSVETVSEPTAQLHPTQVVEFEAEATTAETDDPEEGGQEGVYQSAFKKGYDEGFAQGSAGESDDLVAFLRALP